MKTVAIYCLLSCVCWAARTQAMLPSDTQLSVEQIVKKHGYPFENYVNVSTEDGYLLDIYRIPYGRNGNTNISRVPVMLVHGLTGSSRNFVCMGTKRGLAFYLADRGYDVWIPNCRGTQASRKHRTLDPEQPDFWKFSWHEIGYYDLPTTFELIRNVTKFERISYIGHSQGTTVFYVMASERPEYNRNVSVAVFFGPQAYMTHLTGAYMRLSTMFEPIARKAVEEIGLLEYPPKIFVPITMAIIQFACSSEGFLQEICANSFYGAGGYNPEQLDKKDLPMLVAGIPTFSVYQPFHYAQNINSGEFRKFDFDPDINLKKYGSTTPPSYNLSKITAPVALYYGMEDWMAHPKDVWRLCDEVANCSYNYVVPDKHFNHFDFIIAKDIVKLVYKDLLKVLRRYNENNKVLQ